MSSSFVLRSFYQLSVSPLSLSVCLLNVLASELAHIGKLSFLER